MAVSELKVVIDFIVRNLKEIGSASNELNDFLKSTNKAGITFTKTGAAVKKGSRGFLPISDVIAEISKAEIISSMKTEAFSEMMDRTRLSAEGLLQRMREQHVGLKEGGTWWDYTRGREVSVKEATTALSRTMRRFKMELLSVMFFGQQIGKMFESWLKPAMDAYGIFDMFNIMLMTMFLPVMDTLAPILYDVMFWFMNLPAPIQKAIGWLVVAGMVGGKLLGAFGSLGLGIQGLKLAFPWITKLGEIFGLTSVSMLGDYDELAKASVGLPNALGVGVKGFILKLIPLVGAVLGTALIIWSVWKNLGNTMSLTNKMALDKQKGDWDSYRTHAIMRAIEMRTLIPRTIGTMLYTVGDIMNTIFEFIVEGLWELAGMGVQAMLWLPKQILGVLSGLPGDIGKTFKNALEGVEKFEADFLLYHAKAGKEITKGFVETSAKAAIGYEQGLNKMRYETTRQMVEMGIPIKEIVDEYGNQKEAMDALFDMARAGELPMDELNRVIREQRKQTQETGIEMNNFAFDINSTGKAATNFAFDVSNTTDELFDAESQIDDTSFSLNSLQNYINKVGQAFEDSGGDVDTFKKKLEDLQKIEIMPTPITGVYTFGAGAIPEYAGKTFTAAELAAAEAERLGQAVSTATAAITKAPSPVEQAKTYLETGKTYNPFTGTYFEKGGIVTRPTVGVLGEEGPEVVLPLKKGFMPMHPITIHYRPVISITAEVSQEIDIDRMMKKVDDHIVGKLKSMVGL